MVSNIEDNVFDSISDWLLPHELGQLRGDGVCPDLVAGGGGMEEVGHDLLGDGTVGEKEVIADVEVVNAFPIVQTGDNVVGLVDFIAVRIGTGLLTPGEHAEEQDLGLGLFFPKGADDGGDPFGDPCGGVGPGIVGPDHEDNDARLDALNLALLDAPKDVLGAISTDAKVGWLVTAKGAIPNVRPSAPASGDGVAQKKETHFLFSRDREEMLVQGEK